MNIAVSGARQSYIEPAALITFVESILRDEGVADDASLSVVFIDEADIADLNERFMGKIGPTDVLSFPIEDALPGHPPIAMPSGAPLALGDIFICTDVVATHATEYGASFDDELHLMLVHGVLHILGWDHESDADAAAMEGRESRYLSSIGRVRR